MSQDAAEISPGYSYPTTAVWFIAGALVTAAFSGSLAALAPNAAPAEVLAVGMVVPSFTWAVQLTTSGLALPSPARRLYWGALGRVCLLGSVALLPAALINLCLSHAPLWLSAANVLSSVALMGFDLFHRSVAHGISRWWPVGWCGTIACNMALFAWVSCGWWSVAR